MQKFKWFFLQNEKMFPFETEWKRRQFNQFRNLKLALQSSGLLASFCEVMRVEAIFAIDTKCNFFFILFLRETQTCAPTCRIGAFYDQVVNSHFRLPK